MFLLWITGTVPLKQAGTCTGNLTKAKRKEGGGLQVLSRPLQAGPPLPRFSSSEEWDGGRQKETGAARIHAEVLTSWHCLIFSQSSKVQQQEPAGRGHLNQWQSGACRHFSQDTHTCRPDTTTLKTARKNKEESGSRLACCSDAATPQPQCGRWGESGGAAKMLELQIGGGPRGGIGTHAEQTTTGSSG